MNELNSNSQEKWDALRKENEKIIDNDRRATLKVVLELAAKGLILASPLILVAINSHAEIFKIINRAISSIHP